MNVVALADAKAAGKWTFSAQPLHQHALRERSPMFLKYLRRAAALLAVPALAFGPVAGQAEAKTTEARPALWQVSDPDTKIYLFGTIHLLPKDFRWETPRLRKAIAESDTLVVETIIDPKNPAELARELVRLGYADGLPPLASRIDPAKRAMLEATIVKSGIPRPAFDRMKTWAAAFSLLGTQFKELGLHGEEGVEQTLRDAFAAAGKPIGQLETNGEQLSFFNDLPEPAQRALLEGAIDSPELAGKQFDIMLRAWARGDVEAVGKAFNADLGSSPGLIEVLAKRRNANWSRWIEKRLAAPGTVLVAVGAGHLAGPDSVQTMLSRGGYRIKRVQ